MMAFIMSMVANVLVWFAARELSGSALVAWGAVGAIWLLTPWMPERTRR